MTHLTDIEIAQKSKIRNITDIAKEIGVFDHIELYGNDKAKINVDFLHNTTTSGKLILVTAINPTPAGEGKTTTTIGLGDALNLLGNKTIIALREPSLGPVFGVKGGATGGGYAQVIPMEDINLHFTGDFHAISSANNLLAALIDNHIYHGNKLNIDPEKITWKRVVDMNDRQLRSIRDGLGGKTNGVERYDGFDITVASEVMAILCLSANIDDLKERLGKIVVGYTFDDKPVTAKELQANNAMTALLKDAIKPNLVQTLEGNPAIIHGGPFANIAHGCNSIIATNTALKLSDYVVTEAGFGADLGAEKFLDIKVRELGKSPDAVVIVATIRALKMHGGQSKDNLSKLDIDALKKGLPNLLKHLDNITNVYGLPVIVAINKFPTDYTEEIEYVKEACEAMNINVALSDVWAQGGKGGTDLAKEVISLTNKRKNFQYAYNLDDSIEKKISKLVTSIYGGSSLVLTESAKQDIEKLVKLGYDNLPICMAKTQYSLSDNAKLLGRPEDFSVTVRELKVSAGAGFIVALTGEIMTMPGLPKNPAANNIDIDNNGKITGIF